MLKAKLMSGGGRPPPPKPNRSPVIPVDRTQPK
jgi:hypothetical protein